MARGGAERAPQHLGCQARAAHAAEHHATELRAHLAGKGGEGLDLLGHRLAHREPAQPIPDLRRVGVVLPYRRIAGPDAFGKLGRRRMASSRTATAASRARTPWNAWAASGRRAPCACSDHAEQRLERLGELLDPVVFQRAGDVVEIDPARRQPVHDDACLARVLRQGARHGPVVLEELEGRGRHRVDGVGADERVHVEHVGVRRVLGAGTGPEQSLWPGTRRGQPLPARAPPAIRGTRRTPAARWRWRPCPGGRAALRPWPRCGDRSRCPPG